MHPKTRAAAVKMAQIAAISALVLLYAYGARISFKAIELLHQGKETGPSEQPYPAWTVIHFASALLFAVFAMLQLVSFIRYRQPLFHRYIGRLAVGSGLLAGGDRRQHSLCRSPTTPSLGADLHRHLFHRSRLVFAHGISHG